MWGDNEPWTSRPCYLLRLSKNTWNSKQLFTKMEMNSGGYLPLFTDTEVYAKPVDSQHKIVFFSLRNEAKLAREIEKNAGR